MKKNFFFMKGNIFFHEKKSMRGDFSSIDWGSGG